jgi:hypothetical protein
LPRLYRIATIGALRNDRNVPMMGSTQHHEQSEPCGIMGQTQRRGLAVRRLDLRRDEGQAMAEFAIVAPVFILFIAGLLAFGRVFFYWIDSNHLANETARWAAVDHNPYAPTTLQQHVLDSGTLEFQDASVCINFQDSTPSVGEYLTVKVQKPFYFLPLLNIGNITIRAASTQRIESMQTQTGPTSYKAAPVDGTDNIKTCT